QTIVRSTQRGQLVRFLQERQADWPTAGEQAVQRIFMPHRSIRPAEFAIQSRFGLHPAIPILRRWYDEAAPVFGSDLHHVALAEWADLMLQSRPVPPLIGEILEAWCLDQPVAETAAVVEEVAHHLIDSTAEDGLRAITPMGVSVLLLLANEVFAPPGAAVLQTAVQRFQELADRTHGTLAPAALSIGSLLWRAFDANVIQEAEMQALIHQKPDLLRLLDGHLVL